MSKWDDLKREARVVERALEEKVSAFTTITKKMERKRRAHDEENPDDKSKQGLALEIERFLSTLSDIIDRMNRANDGSTTHEAVLQRYRELHFDYNTDFKRALSAMNEKLDAQKLFQRKEANPSVDSEADAFLKERGILDASSSMANETLNVAQAVKEALLNQRESMHRTQSKGATLSSSFAGINHLVDQIRRKKLRHNTVVALVIAACVCFSLWWVVLSQL
ncbi:hypothetical protein H310_12794 [Aphanomyces invadans]|uniref:Vesicle transport v-SNARE N-terminal domain-containing protein n=1 Tax=Aphanomyces invadans TaxID=157072 RepID=A0A024TGA0_9STRA|nr:hypothetical protein H310_12794 [Aphanomyces invadans]ETV93190.1 hypothetical protein H310_12794 [Aphanomyces invadans]|eukprot:XP_008878212.1 hypothetical protein H310_12794 [Aphanomyces invadans]